VGGFASSTTALFRDARCRAKARGHTHFYEIVDATGGSTSVIHGEGCVTGLAVIAHPVDPPFNKKLKYFGGSLNFESLAALDAICGMDSAHEIHYAQCVTEAGGTIAVCEELPNIAVDGLTLNHPVPDIDHTALYDPRNRDDEMMRARRRRSHHI